MQTGETRVWRTYVGGARLNEWHGRKAEQGFFPEDWASSTTRAVNAGREDLVEGLSRVVSMPDQPYLLDLIQKDPEAFFGKAHLQAFGAQAGFLVKLIDAQERLTIQVHPDQQYAKTVLHSDYGKTESWYVLGGDDHGKKPCIYIGFKPGITREKWKELFETQNIEGMLNCLHRVTVEPGDCFIIKGGVPHAIGYSTESKAPFGRPFIKYTPTWARSFMPSNQEVRNRVAKMKLIPVPELINGKRLLFVDDSIVRGTQLQGTVNYLHECGATEVHMRSACPPIMFGCKYLSFSRSRSEMELIARRVVQELEGDEGQKHLDEYADSSTERGQCMLKSICEKMGFDSLGYQSLDGMLEAIGIDREKVCTYCWSGRE